MSKKAKITPEDIKDRCLNYLADYTGDMATLQQQREAALKAYMQEPYGNEVDGRSKVVMSDVHDTIEWAMPQLMRVFWSGTDPVKISAIGPEDEIKAKLLQQKVNYDLQRGINGYQLFHDWIKDALLYRIGVVKYWWEERTEYEYKEYEDLNELEYQALVAMDDVEITKEESETEEEQTLDPMTGLPMMVSVTKYDVTIRKKREITRPCAEVVPPEEFIFSITMKDVDEATFIAHRKRMHKSEVIAKWDVKEDEVNDMAKNPEGDSLYQSRFNDLGGTAFIKAEDNDDYWYVNECYVQDWDKEGIKRSKKVMILGNQVLEEMDNHYGCPPFCIISPERITHRAVGRSYYDLVADIQQMHTAMVRFMADNVYFNDNSMIIADPTRVVMSDLQNNRVPGGIIRTRGGVSLSECVMPLPGKPLPPQVMTFMEVVKQLSENRTGITRFNMGTDTSSVNRTATGISQIMSAGMGRLELVSRNFAETGIAKLFRAFAQMNVEYLKREVAIQVNEQWQYIRPQDIDIRFDCAVDVGIGTGTKEMQVQQLMQLLNVTVPMMQFGVVTPPNIYNMLALIYENLGYRNPDRFITNPMEQMMQQQLMGQMNPQMGGVPGVNPGGMAAAQGNQQPGSPASGGSGGGAPPSQQSPVSRVFQGNINPNF